MSADRRDPGDTYAGAVTGTTAELAEVTLRWHQHLSGRFDPEDLETYAFDDPPDDDA